MMMMLMMMMMMMMMILDITANLISVRTINCLDPGTGASFSLDLLTELRG